MRRRMPSVRSVRVATFAAARRARMRLLRRPLIMVYASTPRVIFSPAPEEAEAVVSAALTAALAVVAAFVVPASAARTTSTPLFAALKATTATRRSRGPAGPAVVVMEEARK